jgi:rod shape-determining protein MreC
MAVYRRTTRRRYVLLLVVLTAVTLITLDRRNEESGVLGALGRAAHSVVAPVERAVDAVARPVGNWFDGVFSAGSLERENRELRERIDELEGQVRGAESAREENEELHRQLDLPIDDAAAERVSARVINSSYGNFESTITIDRGTSDGIMEDMPVIVADGVVGRVVEVWRDGSKVRLVTDPRFSVAVRIVEGDRWTGIASGRAGSSRMTLELDTARDTDDVDDGHTVETSGAEGSSFPAGLALGEIVEVEPQLGGLPPVVRVEPFVDFGRLEFVAVLRWAPGDPPVTTTTSTTTTSTTVPGATSTTVGE